MNSCHKTKMAIAFVLFVLSLTTAASADNSTILYNTTSAMLELTRGMPMRIDFIKDDESGQIEAEVDLPAKGSATGTSTSDPKTGVTTNEMTITFDPKPPTVESASLQLTMSLNSSDNYWTLTKMVLSFKGNVNGTTYSQKQAEIDARPKQGYTPSLADRACTRGYSICAPQKISWTCYDQYLNSKGNSTKAFRFLLPGMKLQPFFENGTQEPLKFGYEWDCDPLLSIGLWEGLLVSLFLASIVYTAIDYITSLHTPDRFDDPKGKPINVPQTE